MLLLKFRDSFLYSSQNLDMLAGSAFIGWCYLREEAHAQLHFLFNYIKKYLF